MNKIYLFTTFGRMEDFLLFANARGILPSQIDTMTREEEDGRIVFFVAVHATPLDHAVLQRFKTMLEGLDK